MKQKKAIGVILTLVMIVSLLTGCGQSEVEETQSYQAGIYQSTEYGYLSNITVETTFSDSEIIDIKILEQDETQVLFKTVEEQVIPEIIENQSLGIDTISGATYSSVALLSAVAACVDQAGGDSQDLWSNINEKVPGEDEEYTTDIIVVGLGASGFMAAHNASLNGADVMIIEKGATVAASNGLKVSGPFAVDTPVLQEIDSKLTVDKAFYHMMDYSHWSVNAPLVKRCLETSKEAVTQLLDLGYKFMEVDFRFETPFKDEYGGFHLILNPLEERVNIWETTLERDDIDVLYNTTGKKLIMDGENVVGVEAAKKDGTKVVIKADAVILATGGFIGNREMINKYFSGAEINPAGGSLSTGDGINMAIEAGAVMDKTFGICGSEYGGTNSKAKRSAKQDKYDQNTAFKFGVYGGLYVDAQGKRFMDEGKMVDYPMSYGSESIIRNSPYYAVVDQAYVDAMKTEGLYNYTVEKGATDDWIIGNYYKEKILTNLDADIEEGITEGWIYKADTIEDLADFFDTTNLAETVKEYNSYVENGKDLLFNKNPMYLSSVSEGPFYIIQNEFSGWSTIGGIRVDESLRALNDDNKPIPGLYVVGSDAGSLQATPYYDIPGSYYGLAIDSGTIAGKESAIYIQDK